MRLRAITLLAAAALACGRATEAAPPSTPPPSPAATPGPTSLAPAAASALGLPTAASTQAYAGGRPVAWWGERLRRLRRDGPPELYRLTLDRARLNGLAVVEKDGGEVAVAAARAGAGGRP
jgi:hypothetical protein